MVQTNELAELTKLENSKRTIKNVDFYTDIDIRGCRYVGNLMADFEGPNGETGTLYRSAEIHMTEIREKDGYSACETAHEAFRHGFYNLLKDEGYNINKSLFYLEREQDGKSTE